MHLAAGGVTLPLGWAGPVTVAGGALVIAAVVLIAADFFRGARAAVEGEPASGSMEEAARQGKRAEEEKRTSFLLGWLFTEVGVMAQAQGNFTVAEACLLHAIEVAKSAEDRDLEAIAHHNYGNFLQIEGRLEEAEREYLEALRLRPDFSQAHYGYANLLEVSGRPEEAEALYRTALRLRPNYPEAHNNYGLLLQKRDRFQDAEGHYQEALRVYEAASDYHGMAMVLNNLGILAAIQQRWNEARAHLSKALERYQELKSPEAEKTGELLAVIEGQELTAEIEEFLRKATIALPIKPALVRAA